ncbi:hypothetical protein [Kitasatospora aureofaciens]|uniref:hypothetical protein n=1 Tax=Kitasatospora aureofaciens TaxID=1894 RepID=UPI001C44C00B|nr:hypothetical protein [Kitasatospora aureofaciens]MBV6696907.1 hypothetical protein [Kitasatospora aureofaciens]
METIEAKIDDQGLRKALVKRPHWRHDWIGLVVIGALACFFVTFNNRVTCAQHPADPYNCLTGSQVSWVRGAFLVLVAVAMLCMTIVDNFRGQRVNRSASVLLKAIRTLELCSRVAGAEHPAYTDSAKLVAQVRVLRESLIRSAAQAASDLTANTPPDREVRKRAARVADHLGAITDRLAGDPTGAAKEIGQATAVIVSSVVVGKWDDLLQAEPFISGNFTKLKDRPKQKRPLSADHLEGRSFAWALLRSLAAVALFYGAFHMFNGFPMTPSLILSVPVLVMLTYAQLAAAHGLVEARRIISVALSVRRSVEAASGKAEAEPAATDDEPSAAA